MVLVDCGVLLVEAGVIERGHTGSPLSLIVGRTGESGSGSIIENIGRDCIPDAMESGSGQGRSPGNETANGFRKKPSGIPMEIPGPSTSSNSGDAAGSRKAGSIDVWHMPKSSSKPEMSKVSSKGSGSSSKFGEMETCWPSK